MNKTVNNKRSILLGILVIIAIILGFAGWSGHKNSKSNQPAAKTTAATTKDTKAASPKTLQPGIKITELGIEVPVPDSIKDLTYSTKSSKTSDGKDILIAYLSTQSLTALDPACANGGLGALARVDGQYPKDSKTIASEAGLLSMQFSAFYIAFSSPQAYCSKRQDAILLFRDQFTALSGSLELLKKL